MVYVGLILFGLCLGSFVNALVWRLREQEELLAKKPKGIGKQLRKLSITRGRSMCTHCGHALAPKDLIPVVSWLSLGGKCRYCKKTIADTPVTELLLPLLFVISYMVWPYEPTIWGTLDIAIFAVWTLILTGFLALAVYDVKWFILPDKIIVPVTILAAVMVGLIAYNTDNWFFARDSVVAAVVFFGFFYALYKISDERWIGGGDVKLAASLGLVVGTPFGATLTLFFASIIGTIWALPGLINRKTTIKTMLPFGPLLIIATIIVFLWGDKITSWYLGIG